MKLDPADIQTRLQSQGHLRSLEAPKARLKKIQLAGADLSHAKLAGADLAGANLAGANLSHADLAGANLTGANLAGAVLEHADLTKARLREGDLTGARLDHARLVLAVLTDARLSESSFVEADLSDADLNGLELDRAVFRDATMKRVNLSSATLRDTDLEGAHLEEAFLERATFEQPKLARVDLSRANLVGLTLRRPESLDGTRFRDADLAEATLEAVSFAGADLSGAILDQVRLQDVSFEGATLTRADFQGVNGLTEDQIQAIRAAGGVVNAILFEKMWTFVRAHRAAQAALAALVLLVAAGVFLYYQNPAWRPVDTLLAEAQALRDQGKAAEALKIYDMLLPRVKERLDQEIAVLYEKAETLAELNRPEEAATLYAQIAARTSNDRDESINAQMRRAAALSEAGDYETAIQVYLGIAEDATNSPRDVAKALVGLSQTYLKYGFEDKALSLFQKTLERFPHDPEIALEVNLQMAEVYIQRQKYSEAETLLKQLDPLVKDDSQRAALMIRRARLYEEMGDRERSLATFGELIKRYPENPDVSPEVKMDLAQLLVDRGEFTQAARIYKDLIERIQDRLLKSQAQIAYGTLLRQLGKSDEALKLFQLVRKQATDNPELQGASTLEEAETLAGLKRYDEAEALLKEGVQASDPGIAGSALLRLGQLQQERGRIDDAVAVYQQVVSRFGPRGELVTAAQMYMAQIANSLGDTKKAIGLYEAQVKDPTNAAFRGNLLNDLGQAYLDAERLDDAERTFKELLEIKDDPEAQANGRFGLARLAQRRGDRAGAALLYKQAAEAVEDVNLKVTAYDSLGRMHADANELDPALEAWQSILNLVPQRHDAAFAAKQAMADLFASRQEFERAEKLYRSILEGAEKGEVRAGALVALGRMYLDKKEPGKAMAAFQEVLQKHASVPEAPFQARLGLAEAFRADGKVERAIQLYQAITTEVQDPKVASQAMDALAQLYQETGRADEALKMGQQMLASAGQDPEAALNARMAIAAGHRQKGENDKALEIYRSLRAATTDRNLKLTVLDAMAQTFSSMGKHDDAAAAYQEIVDNYKDNQDTLHNAMMGLAGARRGQKKLEEAAALYQKVVDETPDKGMKAWALESLAQTWQEAGKQDKAMAALKAAGQGGGATPTNKLGQADLLRAGRDYAGALKIYEDVAATDAESGNRAWALVYAAQVLSEQEKLDDALERYLKVIEKYPREAEPVLSARLGVASVYRARNRVKEAAGRYEEVAKGDSFPDYRITAALTAGELYLEVEDRTKARGVYDALLKRFPDQTEAVTGAKLGLARIARETGQTKEALAAYQALERGSTDPATKAAALEGIALSYTALGDRPRADEALQTLKSKYPDLVPEWARATSPKPPR